MGDDNYSCIKEVTKVVYLTILPEHSGTNTLGGVCEILESWKSHYIQQLQGIVVGYRNVSLISKRGFMKEDNPVIYCAVKATFDLFYPSVGSFVKARINRVSGDSIGCLIHNTINVAINKKYNVVRAASEFIALDRLILFEIIRINLKKKFIHLKGKITDECVKLMTENDIFKAVIVQNNELTNSSYNDATSSSNETANTDENSQDKGRKAKKKKRESSDGESSRTAAVQNNELTKLPNGSLNGAISSSNESASTEENLQDSARKAKKRKLESSDGESSHKKKRKTTESDSGKSSDKSPKKKKSKTDSQEISGESVGSAGENNVVKNEIDDFEYKELPEFPRDFISPSKLMNHLGKDIIGTDMKLPDVTEKPKKKKGDSLGVDSVPKKKEKSKENGSEKSKHKSLKKKKKEKSRKDSKKSTDDYLSLMRKNITLESEANGFDVNGLPDFSVPDDLENYLGGEETPIDLKSPDIAKKGKKRKRESSDADSSTKKKRKINKNESAKTKEPKKKKKDKSKKDSKKNGKKDKKKKSRDKVIATKKKGYKVKLKKNKDKDKKSKKRKE